MLEVSEEAMFQTVPALARSLLFQAAVEVIQTLCRSLQVPPPHGLPFERVSTMIARQLPLHALGDLAHGFQLGGALQLRLATFALAMLRLMRLRDERHSVIGEGVRVRAEEHGQHWRRTTLPLALSLAEY